MQSKSLLFLLFSTFFILVNQSSFTMEPGQLSQDVIPAPPGSVQNPIVLPHSHLEVILPTMKLELGQLPQNLIPSPPENVIPLPKSLQNPTVLSHLEKQYPMILPTMVALANKKYQSGHQAIAPDTGAGVGQFATMEHQYSSAQLPTMDAHQLISTRMPSHDMSLSHHSFVFPDGSIHSIERASGGRFFYCIQKENKSDFIELCSFDGVNIEVDHYGNPIAMGESYSTNYVTTVDKVEANFRQAELEQQAHQYTCIRNRCQTCGVNHVGESCQLEKPFKSLTISKEQSKKLIKYQEKFQTKTIQEIENEYEKNIKKILASEKEVKRLGEEIEIHNTSLSSLEQKLKNEFLVSWAIRMAIKGKNLEELRDKILKRRPDLIERFEKKASDLKLLLAKQLYLADKYSRLKVADDLQKFQDSLKKASTNEGFYKHQSSLSKVVSEEFKISDKNLQKFNNFLKSKPTKKQKNSRKNITKSPDIIGQLVHKLEQSAHEKEVEVANKNNSDAVQAKQKALEEKLLSPEKKRELMRISSQIKHQDEDSFKERRLAAIEQTFKEKGKINPVEIECDGAPNSKETSYGNAFENQIFKENAATLQELASFSQNNHDLPQLNEKLADTKNLARMAAHSSIEALRSGNIQAAVALSDFAHGLLDILKSTAQTAREITKGIASGTIKGLSNIAEVEAIDLALYLVLPTKMKKLVDGAWLLSCALQTGQLSLNAQSYWQIFKNLTLERKAEKISELLVTFVVPSKLFQKVPTIQEFTLAAHQYSQKELGIVFKKIHTGTQISNLNPCQQFFNHLKQAERQAGRKLTSKDAVQELVKFKQKQIEEITSKQITKSSSSVISNSAKQAEGAERSTKTGLGETQGKAGINLAHEGSAAKVTAGQQAAKNSNKNINSINLSSEAILKNGYYEVNGFRFSKYYYERLWNKGRKAPSLIAKEILEGAKKIIPDAKKSGFFRYELGKWEMVYNPVTKEVWHLAPVRQ